MTLQSHWNNDAEWKREAARQLNPIIARFSGPASQTFTATGTMPDNIDLALVDCTAGAVTITLPKVANSANRTRYVKKIDASANAVTIDGNGSETIDGAATQGLTVQWESKTLIPGNGAWYLI